MPISHGLPNRHVPAISPAGQVTSQYWCKSGVWFVLRKAKTMDIEVDFYGEGSQVVNFDVRGLQVW